MHNTHTHTQASRVPTIEEIRGAAKEVKKTNPTFGIRRIWNAIKDIHPDWTVTEGGLLHKFFCVLVFVTRLLVPATRLLVLVTRLLVFVTRLLVFLAQLWRVGIEHLRCI